jgi:hypothetical protein
MHPIEPIDLARLKVYPLSRRASLTTVDQILIDPDAPPKPAREEVRQRAKSTAEQILAAQRRGASIMLVYGAHLLRNGAALLLERMMSRGWLTHLATNGAGTIHDWEYAWHGASTESVEMGVAGGFFGTWDETATNIHLALLTGALDGLGYGRSLGRLIIEDGVVLPDPEELARAIAADPAHPLTAARAELLQAMRRQNWAPGRREIIHRWKHASIVAQAWKYGVPLTVHPGIGYDIISNHSVFNGAAIGRGGELDFKLFAGSVERLEGGVLLSIGSAIMGPQVFEKTISCVNNLRLQEGRSVVKDHTIVVVDLQDGGGWDWTQGEPPKTNPAYYLRFCKSYSRMGGAMHYLQCDNMLFMQWLYHELLQMA